MIFTLLFLLICVGLWIWAGISKVRRSKRKNAERILWKAEADCHAVIRTLNKADQAWFDEQFHLTSKRILNETDPFFVPEEPKPVSYRQRGVTWRAYAEEPPPAPPRRVNMSIPADVLNPPANHPLVGEIRVICPFCGSGGASRIEDLGKDGVMICGHCNTYWKTNEATGVTQIGRTNVQAKKDVASTRCHPSTEALWDQYQDAYRRCQRLERDPLIERH